LLSYNVAHLQDANVTLPTEGLATSLSGSKDIRIDTKPPAVVAVASRRHGVMTYGSLVDLQVIFDKPVQVDTTNGIPTIAFGLDDGSIKYVLHIRHTVQASLCYQLFHVIASLGKLQSLLTA
jgi:hypothetical protein